MLTSKPPAVHGVKDDGLDQLVRGLVQHQLLHLLPALINVVQVEGGEVCKLSLRDLSIDQNKQFLSSSDTKIRQGPSGTINPLPLTKSL